MLEIYFDDEVSRVNDVTKELITKLLLHAATEEKLIGELELSITFMSDSEIQQINAEYRGKNASTDVISFALEETSEGEIEIKEIEGMPRVLGDILISVDTAMRQAKEYGHDYHREIGFLALHGFLHLLGYDHMNEAEEAEMFGRQNEILASFGLER